MGYNTHDKHSVVNRPEMIVKHYVTGRARGYSNVAWIAKPQNEPGT